MGLPRKHTSAHSATADAAVVCRVGLALLYLSHAVLVSAIFAFEPGSGHSGASIWLLAWGLLGAELLGGLLLLLGVFTRAISLALFPVVLGALLIQAGSRLSINVTDYAYVLVCLLGAVLASRALPISDDESPADVPFLENLSQLRS